MVEDNKNGIKIEYAGKKIQISQNNWKMNKDEEN